MEIREIFIPNIDIPEPIHIEPPIVVDTPLTIDMGVPVIDAPCAVVRDSVTGGSDHFNNDPDGNVAICDATAPFYFAPDYSPTARIVTPKQNTNTEAPEIPDIKTPEIPKTKENNDDNVVEEKEIDCPAKNQQYRLNDVRNAEAQEKVVGFEVIDGKCIEIWEKTDFADKYLPSSSVVATTLVVTIVATSAATATPFITRLLKPIFKQVINRVKKLLGKKSGTKFTSSSRQKKQKLLSKNVDD